MVTKDLDLMHRLCSNNPKYSIKDVLRMDNYRFVLIGSSVPEFINETNSVYLTVRRNSIDNNIPSTYGVVVVVFNKCNREATDMFKFIPKDEIPGVAVSKTILKP